VRFVRRFTPAYGLTLHGRAVALAESVGSAASQFFINAKEQEVRGIEISANHLEVFAKESLRVLHELFTKEERCICGK
jgi:acyl-coenzyme A thioesterase PaaI-like protein